MATQATLEKIKVISETFSLIDEKQLIREDIGVESLKNELPDRLNKINRLKDFFIKYASDVHNEYVQNFFTQLKDLADRIVRHSILPNDVYIAQKSTFLKELDENIERCKKWVPFFVTTAILETGFLDDENMQDEYKNATDILRKKANETLLSIQIESEKAIQSAKELSKQIENSARRTASKISVQAAQDQFSQASNDLNKKSKFWGVAVIISILLLIGATCGFMFWPLPRSHDWTVSIYHTLLRILVLSAITGCSAFCIRIYRAHLHMETLNKHRVRVANSIESFVNSAFEQQQRDLILAKLVEAIVDFGDSGLIKNEKDEVGSPSISGDFVGRILNAISSKK